MIKKTMSDLERLDLQSFQNQEKFPVVLVLDNIRSMHNVGAIFRSADAFNVKAIYLCGFTPCPPHRDIEKTALGATATVFWEYFPSTQEVLAKLKAENYFLAAIEQTHSSVFLGEKKWEKKQKIAFILGNEVEGVSQKTLDLCDISIEIPQFGTKHSLNVSVCAGIVVWDWILSQK